jgi:DNA-binding LytR/AlgR family response regulator
MLSRGITVLCRLRERKMVFVAVCDDEAGEAETLRGYAAAWAQESGRACKVDAFPSAEALWFAYEGGSYDILLLDVEMGGISGIELARRLRASGSRAEIIFITSHFEFSGEGYEVDALHYLVKPVTREKLFQVLEKAARQLAAEPPSVIISCRGETVKLYEQDILYVESFRHDIVIHTHEGEYRLKENISSFEERLSAAFYRVHRSYLVSLRAVVRINRSTVTLEDGTEIPLARGKYDDVNRAFIEQN